jgi:hypothetical protein
VSIWDEMATLAAERRQERERRQRERDVVLQEYAAERQLIATTPQRNERAEQARELRAQQEATTVRFV